MISLVLLLVLLCITMVNLWYTHVTLQAIRALRKQQDEVIVRLHFLAKRKSQ